MHKLAIVVALTVSLLFVTACASVALSTPVAVAGQATDDYPAPATSDPCDLPCRDATSVARYTPGPIQTPDPTYLAEVLAQSLTSQAFTPPSPTSTPTPVAASQLDSLIYRGLNYLDSASFEVVYSKMRWAVEWGDGSDPELVYQAEPTCRMRLRAGSIEMYPVGEKQLGGRTWGIGSTSPPPHGILIYSPNIEQDAFIFGLILPENGSEALWDECVSRAEAVLDTFRLVAQ